MGPGPVSRDLELAGASELCRAPPRRWALLTQVRRRGRGALRPLDASSTPSAASGPHWGQRLVRRSARTKTDAGWVLFNCPKNARARDMALTSGP